MARAQFSPGEGASAPSGSVDLFTRRQLEGLRNGDITEIVQRNQVFSKQDNIRVPRSSLQLPDDPFWHSGRDGEGGGGGGSGGGQGQQSGGKPGQGQEEGEGGQEAGEGAGDMNLTPKEFLEQYLGPFELPNWKRKDLLMEKNMRWKRKGIQTHGSLGRLDRKQTERRRMRRAGAERSAHPERFPANIIPGSNLVPFDPDDYRFGRLVPRPSPDANAVFYCLLDGSYSTQGEPLITAQNAFFVLDKALRLVHKNVVLVMVSHTTEPFLHDTEQSFFALEASGGTAFASTFVFMRDDARKRFPLSKYCRYWAHFTDGDNMSSDKGPTEAVLKELMLNEFNHGFYLEYNTNTTTTKPSLGIETINELPEAAKQHISMSKVTGRKNLSPALKKLLGIAN